MRFLFTVAILAICACGEAGETSVTTKFRSGTLTRRSNGDRIITQPFGRGTIIRSYGSLRKSP